jgi:hypothetical protein
MSADGFMSLFLLASLDENLEELLIPGQRA